MDLTEQAAGAVDALVADVADGPLDDDSLTVARLAWLDGYKAGMVAVQGMANEAFGRIAEQL